MVEVNNLVVVSDIHAGCRLALCPPEGVPLDDGGRYVPSDLQRQLWAHWMTFWDEWLPSKIKGEKFAVVINGDAVEGIHHRSVTQISQNTADQAAIGEMILQPIVDRCEGNFFMIRGTEAHVGSSGCKEEELAKKLGAIPNPQGQHARWELWKRVGPSLVHLLHHVGTTGTNAYEATAVHKELVEAYTEAARWGEEPPDFIVRSHRHRHIQTTIPTRRGEAYAIVTPGWQGKTPFAYKIPGARQALPQFGGILIRHHVRDKVTYPVSCVWTPSRSEVE